MRPPAVRAFAVEDASVQLCWGRLPAGTRTVGVGGRPVPVDPGAGPGTALVEDLRPGTEHPLEVDGRAVGTVRTLVPPPGRLLFRLATVSDCHVGEEDFGVVLRQRERGAAEPYPVRCLRAALSAAIAWGAQAVVVKGDLVQRASPQEWQAAAAVLGEVAPVPVWMTPGNHERKRGGVPGEPWLEAAGVVLDTGVVARRLPGITLVTADSTRPGDHKGSTLAWADEVVRAAAGAPGPVLLAIHHQVQPRLTYWPPGIVGPEGPELLRRLGDANPDTWVVSGHTHRNRTRRYGPVLATEVGSTKDWPGTWAGYAVHEGGMRQVVFKVTGDGTDAWLWRTRRAAGGAWGRWSPGRLEDRCVSRAWARSRRPVG